MINCNCLHALARKTSRLDKMELHVLAWWPFLQIYWYSSEIACPPNGTVFHTSFPSVICEVKSGWKCTENAIGLFFKGGGSQWWQDMTPLVVVFPIFLQKHMPNWYSTQSSSEFCLEHKHRGWIIISEGKNTPWLLAVHAVKAIDNLLLTWGKQLRPQSTA